MNLKEEQSTKSRKELEFAISNAMSKVGGTKEKDICKYLPVDKGGYMHHFTMRKMKQENPTDLLAQINKFIIAVEAPQKVNPKPRARRGTRTRRDQVIFTREETERLLSLARKVGDHEMVAKLSPRRSLASIKRELINSIRQNLCNMELWRAFADAVAARQTTGTDDE